MKFLFACLSLGLLSASALGSFELALVLDRGTKKVHRFDASSGTYLGSFGNFSASVATISLSQSKKEVIVWDPAALGGAGGVAFHYDYNTGELVHMTTDWNTTIPMIGFSPNSSKYLLPLFDGYYETNFDRSGSTFYNLGAVTGKYDNVDAQRLIMTQTGSVLNLVNNVTHTSVASAVFGSAISDVACGSFTAFGGQVATVVRAGGVLQLGLVNAGSITVGASIPNTTTGFSSITGIAATHKGFVAVGKNAGGAATVVNFGYGNGTGFSLSRLVPLNTFSGGSMTDPIDVAVVVAPEPSSLAVGLMGLAALARLRRSPRKKS